MKGRFITFEGCEGAGKSMQLKFLEEYFIKTEQNFVVAREPGGTEISEKIRSLVLDKNNLDMCPECEALLYAAARTQLVSQVILPALEDGKLVLMDRFIDSSFAYQATARGLGDNFIADINAFTIKNCMPDVTILLDIDPQCAFKRKGGFDCNDRIELESLEFHNKVYHGYLQLASRFKDRIIPINCSDTIETTRKNIFDALAARNLL